MVIPTNVTVTINGLDTKTINSLSITGVLTHTENATSEAYKIVINVQTDVFIASGGAIDVDEKGYRYAAGPGGGGPFGMGGSHGGQGSHGRDAGQTPGPTYGSIIEPTTLGSGGGRYTTGENNAGGGAVHIGPTVV